MYKGSFQFLLPISPFLLVTLILNFPLSEIAVSRIFDNFYLGKSVTHASRFTDTWFCEHSSFLGSPISLTTPA